MKFKKSLVKEKEPVEVPKPENVVLQNFKNARLVKHFEPLATTKEGVVISWFYRLVVEKRSEDSTGTIYYAPIITEKSCERFPYGAPYNEEINILLKLLEEASK